MESCSSLMFISSLFLWKSNHRGNLGGWQPCPPRPSTFLSPVEWHPCLRHISQHALCSPSLLDGLSEKEELTWNK